LSPPQSLSFPSEASLAQFDKMKGFSPNLPALMNVNDLSRFSTNVWNNAILVAPSTWVIYQTDIRCPLNHNDARQRSVCGTLWCLRNEAARSECDQHRGKEENGDVLLAIVGHLDSRCILLAGVKECIDAPNKHSVCQSVRSKRT